MARLPRPVITRMSVSPAPTASSTTYWIDGLSTIGSISFGWLLVAGRNRVPRPAAGITAFVTRPVMLLRSRAALLHFRRPPRSPPALRRYPLLSVAYSGGAALVARTGAEVGL